MLARASLGTSSNLKEAFPFFVSGQAGNPARYRTEYGFISIYAFRVTPFKFGDHQALGYGFIPYTRTKGA